METAYAVHIVQPGPVGIDAAATGKRIKELCQEKGITVNRIREQLYIGSFQSVYAWFSGKALPDLEHMYLLSRLLGVPMDEIIIGTQEEAYFFVDIKKTGNIRAGVILLSYIDRQMRKL